MTIVWRCTNNNKRNCILFFYIILFWLFINELCVSYKQTKHCTRIKKKVNAITFEDADLNLSFGLIFQIIIIILYQLYHFMVSSFQVGIGWNWEFAWNHVDKQESVNGNSSYWILRHNPKKTVQIAFSQQLILIFPLIHCPWQVLQRIYLCLTKSESNVVLFLFIDFTRSSASWFEMFCFHSKKIKQFRKNARFILNRHMYTISKQIVHQFAVKIYLARNIQAKHFISHIFFSLALSFVFRHNF